MLGDDDSGCGESASSGDESAPSGDLHHLIEDSNNLEEDYEKYMNEIRKERQTENKTNVPDVIAALMDEYGGLCYNACKFELSGCRVGLLSPLGSKINFLVGPYF